MKKRYRVLAGIAIVVVALAYLVYNGTKSFTEYYMTVAQFVARGKAMVGRPARVTGDLVPSSVVWHPKTQTVDFTLVWDGKSMAFSYPSPRPDNFTGHAQAIAEGSLGADGIFHVKPGHLLVKCPSHYRAQNNKNLKV